MSGHRQRRLTTGIPRIATALTSPTTGDELGAAVHQVIDELVKVEFSGLFLVDPTTGRLRLLASRGFTDEQRASVERSAPGRTPGWVVAHAQRLYVPDTTLDPERALPGEAYRHVRSLIYFPVMRAEACIGVLGAGASAAHAFDAQTIELLAVATSLAGAVGQNILLQERLRAREHLAAQRRLDALLDAAADAIVCCDVAGHITHWNRGAESLLGRTPAEAIGQPVTIIMPERFRALHQGGLERHRATGTSRLMGRPLQLDALHADGCEIPVELVLNRVDEQGATLFVGVLRDLRSRRRLEHEAQLSAALHSAVLSSIGDAVIACDTAARITVLNPVGEALTGWTAAEAQGRPIDEVFRIVSAETREPAEVPVAEVLATGRAHEPAAHTLLVRRDGVEIPIADSAAPVLRDGVMQGVVLTFRDVSRERQRARALRDERERFAALLSTTAAMIYSARLPTFEVEYVSESATLLLGFSTEEMLEPGFWTRAVHPDDLPRVLADLGALYTHGSHVHEYRHRHKDGHYVWLRDQMRLVFDEAGVPTRAIGASFDISARKLDETRGVARLAFKQIISRISRAFLGSDRSPDDALGTALEELGERTRARRVAVLQLRDGRYDCTHEWCADGVASLRFERQRHPIDGFEAWAMAGDGARHVSPIASDGVQRGFLVLDEPDLAPLAAEEADGLLHLVADALAAGLRRLEIEAVARDLHGQLTRKAENQRAAIDLSMEMARAESSERLLATVSRYLDDLVDVGCGSLGHRDTATGQFRLRALGRSPKRSSSPPGATDSFFFLVCGGVDVVVPEEALAGTALTRALETGAAVSTRDHAVEEFSEWTQLRERGGYQQFLSCPLVGPSGTFGVLSVALTHDEPPTPDELGTFTQIAALLAAHLSIHSAREALGALNAQLERRVQARTGELQASEERVERLFQFAPQAMMMFDAAGLVTRSNRGAQALFGYDEQEFLGVSVEAMVPPEARPRHGSMVQTFLHGTAAGPMAGGRAVQGVRRDGSRFTAEITLVSIYTSQEQQVLAGVTDVSAARAAQAELTRSLEEKETLLKEIHHRVKNNLQIISSLLMLQREHMPSDKTRAMLEESVFRVRSMALIHQQLYGVDSLARIDLGEYARTLTETLRSTLAPTARIALRLAPAEVTIEVAVPLGLILNELITNAFKYGMRPKGDPRAPGASGPECDVLVEVGSEGDTVRIAVADSGPGLPLEINPARASTLGLQLVRSLSRQLRGKLTVEREGGTRFALVCPRALGD
jgi:PAS domain S-box-containing protein